MGRDEALGSYGDAVDVAAKVPTLSGVVVALVVAGLVWAWRRAGRRRRTNAT